MGNGSGMRKHNDEKAAFWEDRAAGPGRKKDGIGKRIWLCGLLGGLFAGFAWQWGWQLDTFYSVNATALSSWLVPLLIAAAASPALAWCFARLQPGRGDATALAGEQNRAQKTAAPKLWRAKPPVRRFVPACFGKAACGWDSLPGCVRFGLTASFLFLAWLPVFLAVYPGFFAYDATDELTQVLTGSYVTRHPLLHVLLLGKTVSGVERLTGSYNAGIAAYVLCQMAAMALFLSWETGCLARLGAGRLSRAAALCFFAFFPVIPMYVLCTSKDIWYTAGMLAVVTLLCLAGKGDGEAVKSGQKPSDSPDGVRTGPQPPKGGGRKGLGRGEWIGLGAALFVTAVFRNNGFYVFLLMIPVLLFFAGKKNRKKMALTAGIVLAAVLLQNAVLRMTLHPADTGVQETLTVPIQQLARTWNYSPEVFSGEDRETLFEILPQEVLERYTPKLSDLVKIDFRTDAYEKAPEKYRMLWLKTGRKAPFTYLNAWLMTSYGFWYPDADIDVYNGWRNYEKSSYFSFETEEPGVRDSRFSWLEEQYRKLSLENIVQRIPVVSWMFSPGFLCWVFVFAGLYWVSCRAWAQLSAFLPVFLNWLTVLLGPTYLVRYVLIFWFALPLLLIVINIQMCYTAMDSEP